MKFPFEPASLGSSTMMMKWLPLLLAALCVFPGSAASGAVAPAPRPNIIVILSDDMGYSDIGCYGGEISTPRLDALATNGLRFTQFYNTARCCPTRASLLTGLHPHQAGIGHMMGDRGHAGYRGTLNRSCVTLAEALKPAGYRSYAVGKWHVTPGQTARALEDQRNWPLQRGFDRYYGTIHGAGSYFDPSSLVRDNKLITVANDPEYRPKEFYYTDAIADHAVRFIREHARDHRAQPFFLYTAFTAAHWPMHAKAADIARYQGRYREGYAAVAIARWQKQRQLGLVNPAWTPAPLVGNWSQVKDRPFEERCMEVYAAMVDCMDQGIGRLVDELKAQGQLDDTLILYLQDNGGCAEGIGRGPNPAARADKPSLAPMGPDAPQFDSQPKQTRDGWPVRQGRGVMPGGPDTYVAYGREWANVSNTPFREYKHWTHEGGISTPLIAHWPAGLAASRRGQLEAQPGQLVDIMATCLDLAGASYPSELNGETIKPLEGTSLRPALEGKPLERKKPLVWEHEGNRAVRDGRWKLVAKENEPWELYDLDADRGETHDLASAEPDRVKTMAATWDAWAARANVLPLGAWRERGAGTNEIKQTRFVLKAGDRLDRAEAPPIAGRSFQITAKFDAGTAREGVLVAQGGSALGFSLYLAGGRLHFLVRNRSGVATVSTPLDAPGAHTAVARLDAPGSLTLQLDALPEARATARGPIATMPADGLDVGADEGGAVGPYPAPNRFSGTIESVILELLGAAVATPGVQGAVSPFGAGFPNLDSLAAGEWWNAAPPQQNPPPPMDVPRDQVVAFALYTHERGVLKLTAQLYPLKPGEPREARLEFLRGGKWVESARAPVLYPGWSAHFRVAPWDAGRDVRYRVRHGDSASFDGRIRRDPKDRNEIVVASLSCNSSRTTGLRPEILDNLKAQDPDLLFFAGDQTYRHTEHTAGWIEFGLQFRDVLRDRPSVAIPDDHDVGHPNLWGENGRQSLRKDNSDGGYFYPVAYVNMVQRQQTWHLPDPVDPAPVGRGITVYFTRLRLGGLDFAILEDRKFKSGPQGRIPQMGPRPDHITNALYDPKSIDLPGLELLGSRQEKFLREWGQDWTGAELKAVLSQTAFCGAVHMHGGRNDRLLADLDCNGWPQTPRRRALEEIRRARAVHLCGDQHLAVVVKHGLREFGDGPYSFTSPALVNTIYGRWWHPADEKPGPNPVPGSPLPWTGDYFDGLGNRISMLAYANPPDIRDERQRGDGYGIARFNKRKRTVTFECWPRFADARRGRKAQFPGWPITVNLDDNDGRKPTGWLPELRFARGERPVVQVIEQGSGEILYTVRAPEARFRPPVFSPGRFLIKVGADRPDAAEFGPLEPGPPTDVGVLQIPSLAAKP